jgi:hypothetical protein
MQGGVVVRQIFLRVHDPSIPFLKAFWHVARSQQRLA